jgi:thiol-disulfide isomerase/thioredoxin
MDSRLAAAASAVFIAAFVLLTIPSDAGQAQNVISAVRAAIAQQNFTRGEEIVAEYRAAHGDAPDGLEALSWLGRGALAAGLLDKADAYARETHERSLKALQGRRLDDEPRLPIALGAAIEVQAQVAAQRGERSAAVYFLRRELATYEHTSLFKRIQKNINLLSLEGMPAPALDLSEHIGAKPLALDALKGKVAILFFWAHWCPDCKIQGPILADLLNEYGKQGLTIVAPTQRFGYVAAGAPAESADERRYIEQMIQTHYPFLGNQPVPLSESNHKRYGVSTTPTLVLVDRDGLIRLYHPGRMPKEALAPLVQRLVVGSTESKP